MPRVGFEPPIPVFERLKTVRALDRAGIGTGKSKFGLGPLACYDSEFDF
jgi:hypothetical protein